METKKLSKLSLKKEIISELNKKELSDIQGGWTTTIGDCSHFGCCCTLVDCLVQRPKSGPENITRMNCPQKPEFNIVEDVY